MTIKEIESGVYEIVRKRFDVQHQISHDTSFKETLAADSLDILELSIDFEDKFNVVIPDSDLWMIDTIGNAIDYIVKVSSENFDWLATDDLEEECHTFHVTVNGFKTKAQALEFLKWYEGSGEQQFFDHLEITGKTPSDGCNINVSREGNTGRYYDELSDGYFAEVI